MCIRDSVNHTPILWGRYRQPDRSSGGSTASNIAIGEPATISNRVNSRLLGKIGVSRKNNRKKPTSQATASAGDRSEGGTACCGFNDSFSASEARGSYECRSDM